jgi:hypothetical protein
MSNDRAEAISSIDAAATTDKQLSQRDAKGVPASAATPIVPWTSKFHLPSIRFRASKRA